jgi:hypothetical protein
MLSVYAPSPDAGHRYLSLRSAAPFPEDDDRPFREHVRAGFLFFIFLYETKKVAKKFPAWQKP